MRRTARLVMGMVMAGGVGYGGSGAAPLVAQGAGAGDESQIQVIAGRRAAEVVKTANADSLLASYAAVVDFLAPGEWPYGKLNEAAPPETEEWGRLSGAWYVENRAYVNGQWWCCWNAVWAWRYILDGFAVQDFWYVKAEDLPPTATAKRASTLTQLRVYRPAEQEWFIGFVTNGGKEAPAGVHGTFRSYRRGDDMVMEPPPPEDASQPRVRIVFFDISRDHFSWARELSTDGGATWERALRIEAYRIPWSRDRR